VFAIEDARALSDEIARARSAPALDPRLEPFLDRAAARLRAVRDEAGLDAAVAELRPVLDALARWPAPVGTDAAWDGPPPDRGLSDFDLRVLRFGAVYSALWALEHSPDDEAARHAARTALGLAHRTGLERLAAPSP
jgi:hypothetical protein